MPREPRSRSSFSRFAPREGKAKSESRKAMAVFVVVTCDLCFAMQGAKLVLNVWLKSIRGGLREVKRG